MTPQLRVFIKIVPLFSISTFVAALTVTAAFTMSIGIYLKCHLVQILRIEGLALQETIISDMQFRWGIYPKNIFALGIFQALVFIEKVFVRACKIEGVEVIGKKHVQ
jgi:hypothetical protein